MKLRPLVPLLLGAVLTGSCGPGSSPDQTDALPFDPVSAQYRPEAINIGAVYGGQARLNALYLATQHVNAAGGVLGRPYNAVGLVARDLAEAVAFTQALLDAGVPALQISGSARVVAATPLLVAHQAVQISDSATSPALTTLADNDLIFRIPPSDIYQGQVLAELALNAGKRQAVIVFEEGDPYGEGIAQVFSQHFVAGGGTVLGLVRIPASLTTGFDAYLPAIYAPAPDVVLNAMLNETAGAALVNESAPYQFRGLTLFPDSIAANPNFLNNIADLNTLVDAHGVSPGLGDDRATDYRYFRDAYRAQFDLEPEAFSSTAYDAALVTALAIEHAGRLNGGQPPSGVQIRDSLRAVMNPPGIKLGPSRLAEALALVRAGTDIDYSGAYSDTDWDSNGDVVGQVVYNVFSIDYVNKTWQNDLQLTITVPAP